LFFDRPLAQMLKIPRLSNLDLFVADAALLDVPRSDVAIRHASPELVATGEAYPIRIRGKLGFAYGIVVLAHFAAAFSCGIKGARGADCRHRRRSPPTP